MADANPTLLAFYIRELFDQGKEGNLSEQVEHVGVYFGYLADSIDADRYHITAERELLEALEAVYLWLSNALLAYPTSIRDQVRSIFVDSRLCQVFAIIASLSENQLQYFRRSRLQRRLMQTALFKIFTFGLLTPR